MNDPTHTDSNASPAGPSEKHETLVLFEQLQELRGTLRKAGVIRVLAAYDKNCLTVAFLNSQEIAMVPPKIDQVVDELSRLLGLVIRRRRPVGNPHRDNSGTFNWHLVDDALVHKQTVTFRGI